MRSRTGRRGIGGVTIEATDADLVARARSGDDRAFGMLVERHQTVAFRTAYVICGDTPDAEDAAQDGFIKARAAMGRFRAGAPFRPWLLRIVVNQTRNLHRGRSRRLALELRAGAEPDQLVDPEQLALAGLRRDTLLAAVRSLPVKDQLVVTCRYFLDLGEEETARVLGWPRGSVKSRTSRALTRLRAELAKTAEEVTGG